MASPEDLGNDVTVLVPQRLIDMAMRNSAAVTEEIVPYDEGLPIEQPLYLEEEPRPFGFGRLLLMSAIVGSLVIFTGLQVADSHAPAALSETSVSSGVETMSAAELIQSIKAENRTVYWLNAKRGDSYANKSSANGIDQITYRPAGANISDLAQFDVIVGTYKDYATYDAQPHPLLGANGRTTTLTNGATVTYNSASPNQAVVQFADKSEVVVINYPAAQAVPTLINDAENLVPVN